MNVALLMAASLAGVFAAAAQPAAPSPDPALVEELRVAVELMRPQLPIRADPITVTDISTNGAELVYHMSVPMDLDPDTIEKFEEELPRQACANEQARRLFERGGAFVYVLRDPDGDMVRTSINRC